MKAPLPLQECADLLFFADGPGQQLYVLRRPSLKHKQTLATYTYSAPIAELAVDCSPADPLLYVLLANSQLFEERVAQLAENAEYSVQTAQTHHPKLGAHILHIAATPYTLSVAQEPPAAAQLPLPFYV